MDKSHIRKPDYQQQLEALDPADVAVAVAENRSDAPKEKDTITFSTGVRVRITDVPKVAFARVWDKYTQSEPTAPMVYVESKGREEPNPDDPDYIAAQQQHQVAFMNAISNIAILRSTEVLEVPDGLPHWDDADWKEEMEIMGLDASSEKRRLLEWFWLVAAVDEVDTAEYMALVGRKGGVSRGDVDKSARKF